jgi:F-type H+-transporting ATPase subunit delta
VLVEEVDPSVLGGLIVQVGDRQFDGSLRTKLSRMREFVIERGRQEILSGKHDFWED